MSGTFLEGSAIQQFSKTCDSATFFSFVTFQCCPAQLDAAVSSALIGGYVVGYGNWPATLLFALPTMTMSYLQRLPFAPRLQCGSQSESLAQGKQCLCTISQAFR